jgi:hypothetical protein
MPKLEATPFVAVPVGTKPCVACSDFRQRPGQMWMGYSRGSHGEDLFITCPVCKGTGEVPRLKHLDVRTGKEIDYEKPGQRFVYLGTEPGA